MYRVGKFWKLAIFYFSGLTAGPMRRTISTTGTTRKIINEY